LTDLVRCPGCGARFPGASLPGNGQFGASPGCWAVFSEVLAKEYGDPAYFAAHQMTVDAYKAQHPGAPSPQAVRAMAAHLIALCMSIERGASIGEVYAARKRAAEAGADAYMWLDPPPADYPITILDVVQAQGPEAHTRRVREWAESVWARWAAHHETIRAWAGA